MIPLPLNGQPQPAHVGQTMPTTGPLIDTFQRMHNNLRISVTDRCNLRCTYCMPEEVQFRDKSELLTFEEIARVVRIAANCGVNKIRLTGGEPLLRREIHHLIAMLSSIPGIDDIGLTTNAVLLAQQAESLYQAGLHRLNVSVDTLDEDRFLQLTRRTGLPLVLAGLARAKEVGFQSIKVNAVCIRGTTEHDILPLAAYCLQNGFSLRFIEYMPIGADAWEREKVLFAAEIQAVLEGEYGPLQPVAGQDPHAPAQEFAYAGGGNVGFIASISRPFCHHCNRIRLTAEGAIRHCLFATEETPIRDLLRTGASDSEIELALRQTIWGKWEGHEINTSRFLKPTRTMHTIGG
ncbi:MAG: GTP 3',8-cyclase MoaA [Zavarzinella sp.]